MLFDEVVKLFLIKHDNCFCFISDYGNYLTSYPLGFTLFVSNTSNRHDGVMCYQERNFRKNTIPAKLFTRCPYIGQFVIYHIERVPGITYHSDYSKDAHADLCEVEVFGIHAKKNTKRSISSSFVDPLSTMLVVYI